MFQNRIRSAFPLAKGVQVILVGMAAIASFSQPGSIREANAQETIASELATGNESAAEMPSGSPDEGMGGYYVSEGSLLPSELFGEWLTLGAWGDLPCFRPASPDAPDRHVGRGSPLIGTSWLNRPWHFDWFLGGMVGDGLISGQIEQSGGMFGGLRFGKEFNHYWGGEMKLAGAFLAVEDPGTNERTADHFLWDASLVWYPWGDAAWRPYTTFGLGLGSVAFEDSLGRSVQETFFHVPIGVGCKYYFRNWLAFRFEVADHLEFGGGRVDTMNNLAFSGGMELRIGARPKLYWPYQPGMHQW